MDEEEITIAKFGRISGRAFYEFQEVRKGLRNMARDVIFRKSEGIGLNERLDEGQKAKKEKNYSDNKLLYRYEELKEEGKLSEKEISYIDDFMNSVERAEQFESMYENLLGTYLKNEPIWYNWLKDVRGIGDVTGAGLVNYFGYGERYEHVSSLWKHCGMHPQGAKGRRKGQKIEYSPKRKTFVWKIGKFAFTMMQKIQSPYDEIREDYKQKQLSRMKRSVCQNCGEPTVEHSTDDDGDYACEDGTKVDLSDFAIQGYNGDGTPPWSKGHAEARTKRKVVKTFLQHYWVIGRQLKGMETGKPYPQSEGGHRSGTYVEPPHIPSILEPFEPDREAHWVCEKMGECVHPEEDCEYA